MDILTIQHKDFTLSIECSKWEGVWNKAFRNVGVDNLTSIYSWSDGVESVVLKTSDVEKCLLNGMVNEGVFFDNAEYPIWVEFKDYVNEARFGSMLKSANENFSFRRQILAGFLNYGNEIGKSEILIDYKIGNTYHPTAAGLLMFGYEHEITNEFPQYFLDYREEMDESVRWTHRLTSTSGDWSENLYDFFWKVYPRLKSDLPIPFKLKDGVGRVDEDECQMCIREFLLNCLAHADHYGRQGIVIRRNVRTMQLANPGDIRIGLEAALNGGTSDPRNSTVMKMFGLVGIGDRAGTGMTDAIAVAKEKLNAIVDYSISLEPERTTLNIEMLAETRDKSSKQGINEGISRDKEAKQGINTDVNSKSRDKILQIEGISEKTRDRLRLMIAYMSEHPVVKNHEIAELLGVGDDRVRVLLMLLVDNGILIAKGDKKERTYTLKSEQI